MAERRNAERGLIDGLTAELGGPRTTALLAELDAATPWSQLLALVQALPEYGAAPRGGRPAWPAQTMLRCLLLAKWFNLSDPQLEDLLQDRLSFRRFAGLALADATPDQTTFVRFRTRLREAGVHERLMAALSEHLDRSGLLVREGTLVDATIIHAPRGRRRDDGKSTTDPDAASTSKNGLPFFGYKAHLSADRSGLVTACQLSNARAHDGRYLGELTAGERTAVFADSAYESAVHRATLAARGVLGWIVYQRRRGQAVLPWHRHLFNQIASRTRARIEHVMAELKQRQGFRRVRYRGLERNRFDLHMHVIAMNLRRSVSLRRA